jgi:hypothetical protein
MVAKRIYRESAQGIAADTELVLSEAGSLLVHSRGNGMNSGTRHLVAERSPNKRREYTGKCRQFKAFGRVWRFGTRRSVVSKGGAHLIEARNKVADR